MEEEIVNKTIDEKAQINVNVPGAIFVRLNQLLINGLGMKTQAELQAAISRVKLESPANQNNPDYHIETILFLNMLISQAAQEQGKMVDFKVSVPKPPVPPQ